MENGKTKSTRDSDLSKELGLESCNAKRVQAFLICYHYGQRRCIYSTQDDDDFVCMEVLQQKLESVSERYSYGDLLFDDSHRLSKVLAQKKNQLANHQLRSGPTTMKVVGQN